MTGNFRGWQEVKRLIRRSLNHLGFDLVRKPFEGKDPVEMSETHERIWRSCRDYTMCGRNRTFSLIASVEYLIRNNIPGDFVECGVWRGGSCKAMALTLRSLGVTDRNIWLFDTFAGMTAPTSVDRKNDGELAARKFNESLRPDRSGNEWCYASLPDVEGVVGDSDYPWERFRFIKGDVAETLRTVEIGRIALLRLDTDWYESTRIELETLYPRLSTGGICIIDDYGVWQGSRLAVDEYFQHQQVRPLLTRVDPAARLIVKV